MFGAALDHACILDGARLSYGRVLKYPHNDMDALEERLRSVEPDRGALSLFDGVFSVEGEGVDLPRVVVKEASAHRGQAIGPGENEAPLTQPERRATGQRIRQPGHDSGVRCIQHRRHAGTRILHDCHGRLVPIVSP